MILIIEKDNYISKVLQLKYSCVHLQPNDFYFFEGVDLIIINFLDVTEEYLNNLSLKYKNTPILVITDRPIEENSLRYVVNSKTDMLTFDYLIKKMKGITQHFMSLCESTEKLSNWSKKYELGT